MTTITLTSSLCILTQDENDDMYYDDTKITAFPVIISKTSTSLCFVKFTSDLRINNTSQYFIINSNNIILDGQGHIVNINDVPNYPGLVLSTDYDSTIQNIGVHSNNSTLAEAQGWILQQNGVYTTLFNCFSDGVISPSSGGICGAGLVEGTINNCYSLGNIIYTDPGHNIISVVAYAEVVVLILKSTIVIQQVTAVKEQAVYVDLAVVL
ncbi:MAG: hypothetical protein EOO43_01240 [Flavobacterium sp.]|nr:MAG: hypothetical protein EOO43_01240 [Flavobacterium sp.]